MKVLVTGTKGQLGKAIIKNFYNEELTITDINSLDITNMDQAFGAIKRIKPAVIINCAALTDVNRCELDKETAYKINTVGINNLVLAANDLHCELVHISTDYVFDGDRNIKDKNFSPYVEDDLTNPKTFYGITKRLSECTIQDALTKHYIIRTSWLYGDGENFISRLLRQVSNKVPICVVTDQFGTPTSTEELALFIKVLIREKAFGLFHGSCEGFCSRYQYAQAIFKFMGINYPIIPIRSQEIKEVVKRPSYSVLENKRLKTLGIFSFSHWEDALKNYMIKKIPRH